jgi:hypothetical protein
MPVPHIFPVTRSKIRYPAEQRIAEPLRLNLKRLLLCNKKSKNSWFPLHGAYGPGSGWPVGAALAMVFVFYS